MEFRRLAPDRDLDDVFQLGRLVFQRGADPSILDIWKWKYNLPWVREPHAWVAISDGEILGHVGAVPLRGWVDGEEVPFFQLTDIMIHPEHRAKYDFLTLAPKSIEVEIRAAYPKSVLYGFTGRRTALWYRRMGGRVKEEACDRLVRIAAHEPEPVNDQGIEFAEWSWDRDEIDEIWGGSKIRAGLMRDRTYISWRYERHPTKDYTLIGVLARGEPVGWFVTQPWSRVDTVLRDEVRLLDHFLPEEVARPALQLAARYLKARTLVFWLPKRLWEGESRETGWFVLCKSLYPDLSTEYLAEHLDYSLGEVDEWWW